MSNGRSFARRLQRIEDRLNERPAGEEFERNERTRQELCYIAEFVNGVPQATAMALDAMTAERSHDASERQRAEAVWGEFNCRVQAAIEASGDAKLAEYIGRHWTGAEESEGDE